MSYPRIEIDLNKIKHNSEVLINLCDKHNIEVVGVTKVFCAFLPVAHAMFKGGITMLADSRIENLEKLKEVPVPKILLRLPMISQANKVVELADISLNSELDTINALSQAAIRQGKNHKIVLMIDLGDLREGIFNEDEVFETVEKILQLSRIKLVGIGTNLTCYGGIIPRKENLSKLIDIKNRIEDKFNISLDIISGGNSSSIHLLESGEMPDGITQLRLGESIVLGRETAFGERIDNTYDDVFKLIAEIVEIKDKPSIPIGEIGMDAFGSKPTFEDKGIRRRAICAIGKQDIDVDDVIPDDNNISILGSSSDHFILDITNCDKNYKVGDKVSFKLTYGGVLSAMTSEYVAKVCK